MLIVSTPNRPIYSSDGRQNPFHRVEFDAARIHRHCSVRGSDPFNCIPSSTSPLPGGVRARCPLNDRRGFASGDSGDYRLGSARRSEAMLTRLFDQQPMILF